jgi:putative membrane protein
VAGNREKASFFRLFQLIVVLAWILGLWFLCADVGGDPLLAKFLRPDYWWIVEMGVGILILFLISLVYCDPHNRGRRGIGLLLQMGIMIVPLLYLPAAVRSELSPDAAKKRSFSMSRFGRTAENASLGRTSRSSDTGGKAGSRDDQLPGNPSLIRLIMKSSHYEGKRVATLGKICLDDRLPKGSFFCYRLLMVCCAADASPVGVMVHYDKIDSVKNGDWVRVEGKVGFTTFQGHRAVKLVAERVEPASQPKDPYVWW